MSQIFLYTVDAKLDARTKKAMLAAGYLPVCVASLDAVKFLEPAPTIPNAEISEITRAALHALITANGDHAHKYSWQLFVETLAKRLIAAKDAADLARCQE